MSDSGEVRRVTIGTKTSVSLGGNGSAGKASRPVVIFEVYDWVPPLPKPVKAAYKDKLNDPVAWAKCCVEEFGAEMICLELLSTNPYTADASIDEAMKTLSRVLEAVDVPVMVGGSGDAGRDTQVLAQAAKVASGRRVLLSSVTQDTYRPIVPAAAEYGQAIVASTTMSMETAIAFNRDLVAAGMPLDSIVMDLSTCPLGYGYEYSYTLVERTSLQAAGGSTLAQVPILFCPANSWAARESRALDLELGDPATRGPLWETAAGIGGLSAGAHALLVLDPNAGTNLKHYIEEVW
jgi:acetyl-CoA decarbonylase/synthase complex subunit delta